MKQIWKWIIVVPIVVGIIVAVSITAKKQMNKLNEQNKQEKIFGNLVGKNAEITKFYTYGTSLNLEGRIKGVSKDNFEGIKLLLTNGEEFEKLYRLSYSFEDGDILFGTGDEINSAIVLDELAIRKIFCSSKNESK
ncbi:MAG: hypothetical protein IJ867_01235 [Clostridia bacterium]|nr:hypothetical protein [Clostridia bacterium]